MTSTADVSSVKEPIIVMTRLFDAPRELVWEALTDPRHVVHWYGGDGFENPVCEMDVRPGGRWRHVMRTPDGGQHPLEFVFLEVIRPEKLVWRNADHGQPGVGGPHDNLISVTLEALGRRTRWVMVARFNSFEDREAAQRIGFTTVLKQGTDRFAAILARLAA